MEVNYLYRKKLKEKRKIKRKKEQGTNNVWLFFRFLPISLKIFYSYFCTENFISVPLPEDNIIDLFKIFILNYSIKIDTCISRTDLEQYVHEVYF